MDIKDELDDLRCIVFVASRQDDLQLVRYALYVLRAKAWTIMAEIDKQAMDAWKTEQAPAPLKLEDIGL